MMYFLLSVCAYILAFFILAFIAYGTIAGMALLFMYHPVVALLTVIFILFVVIL